jgi:hypothetical protein
MEQDNKRTVTIGAIVFTVIAVVTLGYFIFTSITHAGKLAVTVNIVPSDARATFNGQPQSSGIAYLKKGSYEIKASKKGFADFSEKIMIDHDHQAIPIGLNPISSEAKKWADDNQQLYFDLEGEAGDEAIVNGNEFRNKNPITDALPYENALYTIGYRADPADSTGNSIIIEIDAPEGYRNAAIQQIRDLGYEPTDFKINFRDYTNPFSS